MRKIFSIFLCVMLLFTFTSYAQNEYGTGYIDFKPLYEMPVYTLEDALADNEISFFSENVLPEFYKSPYVSSVKNQSNGGTCWAFSVAGAMESFLLSQEDETNQIDKYDFSENHMQYMISNWNNNPVGHEIGIGKYSGGNIQVIAPYLMNRRGPVNNEDDVYAWNVTTRDYSETANIPLGDYIVSDIAILRDLSESDYIGYNALKQKHIEDEKKLIMTYGAAMCSMSSYGFVDTSQKHCYLCEECFEKLEEEDQNTNHMVLAVGWNDNYSRENFKHTNSDGEEIMPEYDGAFIIKNSWGSGRCDEGYFYLSYYDYFSTERVSAITGMKKREDNQIVYSHDDFFPIVSKHFGTSTVYYGNLFERKTKNESIDEIIFYAIKGNEYEFYLINQEPETFYYSGMLYLNFENLKPIKLSDESYIFSEDGYYTVDVPDTPITTEKFSVVVCEKTTDGTTGYVWGEANYEHFEAVTEPMQSFAYPNIQDGVFQDFGSLGLNVSVKAVTITDEKHTDISFVNYTNENKEEKTTFKEGDTVRIAAVVDGVNLEGAMLVCGIYNGNKLIKVLHKPMGNKENVFVYEKIPADFENYTVRVFAIDAYDNIKPLGNVLLK